MWQLEIDTLLFEPSTNMDAVNSHMVIGRPRGLHRETSNFPSTATTSHRLDNQQQVISGNNMYNDPTNVANCQQSLMGWTQRLQSYHIWLSNSSKDWEDHIHQQGNILLQGSQTTWQSLNSYHRRSPTCADQARAEIHTIRHGQLHKQTCSYVIKSQQYT